MGNALLALWRLSRPEAWMVSILPVHVGYVLASRQLLPGLGVVTSLADRAQDHGVTTADVLAALADWWAQGGDWLLALVVMGPLIWIPTLLWNDVQDLPGDRLNPRKARSPLVQGVVSAGWATRTAYASSAACLAVALTISTAFTAFVTACLALAWLYSVPPARLKTRPGADLFVNAIGVGLLSALAGWVLAAPLADFPFIFAPQGILVAIAVYVPTTLVDHAADKEAGYATLATHLGRAAAYKIGWWAWVLANVGALALAAANTIIPRAILPVLLVFVPVMLYAYHAHIGRAPDGPETVKGIILCSFIFLAVNLLFAVTYTGLWRV